MIIISQMTQPDHGVRHQQNDTSAVINNKNLGIGTLFITESNLAWINRESGEGFSLQYPHISIHAVSRDRQSYPEECLYLLLDIEINIPTGEEKAPNGVGQGEGAAGDGEESDEEKESSMTELRFIPGDKSCLDAMYTAMCDCQVLHPDSQDSFSEDEDANDDEDEGVEADDGFDDFSNPDNQHGAHRATNGDNDMDVDEGQFEDAPDD